MFINKAKDGRNNICGKLVAEKRIALKISQQKLSNRLQLKGLDIDKNAIQRIECGKRFVTDIELLTIMEVLDFTIDDIKNFN